MTVWKWFDLNARDWSTRSATFQGQNGVRVESGTLLERPVILSDLAAPEGYMTWYTDGQCTRAEAFIQATDSGLGLGHVAFTVDGAVVQERDVEGSTGQRLVVRQDITGSRAHRLQVEPARPREWVRGHHVRRPHVLHLRLESGE